MEEKEFQKIRKEMTDKKTGEVSIKISMQPKTGIIKVNGHGYPFKDERIDEPIENLIFLTLSGKPDKWVYLEDTPFGFHVQTSSQITNSDDLKDVLRRALKSMDPDCQDCLL